MAFIKMIRKLFGVDNRVVDASILEVAIVNVDKAVPEAMVLDVVPGVGKAVHEVVVKVFPRVVVYKEEEVEFERIFLELYRQEQNDIMRDTFLVMMWPTNSQMIDMPTWQKRIVNRTRTKFPHTYPLGSISAPECMRFEWECLQRLRLEVQLLPQHRWPSKGQRKRLTRQQQRSLSRAYKNFMDLSYSGFRTV